MNVRTEIIGMHESPTGAAVAAAVRKDINRLAQKHVADVDGDWPSSRATNAAEKLSLKVARELMCSTLNSEAMRVIDAVIACDAAERVSVYGRETDYETPTTNLEAAATNLSDYTCDVVKQHMGEEA